MILLLGALFVGLNLSAAPVCWTDPAFVEATRHGVASVLQSAETLKASKTRFIVPSDKYVEVDRAARLALEVQAGPEKLLYDKCRDDCMQATRAILFTGTLLLDAVQVQIDCSPFDIELKEELKIIANRLSSVLDEIFAEGMAKVESLELHDSFPKRDQNPICKALKLRIESARANSQVDLMLGRPIDESKSWIQLELTFLKICSRPT
ncbi:MAG: hypothetical protein AB7F86_01195 [Bdellovibrionales bacterium]